MTSNYGTSKEDQDETETLLSQQTDIQSATKKKYVQLTACIILVVIIIVLSITLPLTIGNSSSSNKSKRYLYVYNASWIWTVDENQPTVSAFCIDTKTELITAIGDEDGVLMSENCSTNAKQIDAQGYYILPGLIDSHAHLVSEGTQIRYQADLSGAKSVDEIIEILSDFRDSLGNEVNEDNFWIRGWGWDQNQWVDWNPDDFPDRWQLDAEFPDIPIYLKRIDGHACWTNTAAFYAEGVKPLPDDNPDGGEIIRDAYGNATGVFIDNAMWLISDYLPDFSAKEYKEALKAVFQKCSENGLTGVHDAGEGQKYLDYMRDIIDKSKKDFTIRANVLRSSTSDLPTAPQYDFDETKNRLRVKAVKFYMDGALGSWGAAMIEPYCDLNTSYGLFRISEEEYYANISAWHANGYQIGTHAIGDAANRVTINNYEKLLEAEGLLGTDHRLRIEHAQIINQTDVIRCGELGIIPVMQPTHATSDMVFAPDRLCEDRLNEAYPWKSFLNASVVALPLGSDFPAVGVVNPFLGFYASITRQNESGWPEGGWLPNQRISIEQTIRGYTIESAYAAFQEDVLGSISVGKFGDFIIIDTDPFEAANNNPMDILGTQVVRTYLGGSEVYRNPNFDL